jgi:hypothetical protein
MHGWGHEKPNIQMTFHANFDRWCGVAYQRWKKASEKTFPHPQKILRLIFYGNNAKMDSASLSEL